MAKPTFKEYSDMVKPVYESMLLAFDREETDRYWNGENCQKTLKRMYDGYSEDYDNHELGDKGFRKGAVDTAAMNLSMLFEPEEEG